MDPICTLLFSVITLCTTITVAKDLIRFIMEGLFRYWRELNQLTNNSGSPASLDIDHIKTQINVPGVVRIHDLHVWGLTPQQWVLTAHVVIGESAFFLVCATNNTEIRHIFVQCRRGAARGDQRIEE